MPIVQLISPQNIQYIIYRIDYENRGIKATKGLYVQLNVTQSKYIRK